MTEPQQAAYEAMEKALRPFANEAVVYGPNEGDDNEIAWDSAFKLGVLRAAVAALSLADQAKGD